MALKKCAPTERGPKVYERNVKDAKHKPKVVAARFVKDWKKQLGRGTQVCAVKAEATLPRGWDYGFYGLFEITLADGDALRAAVSIHYDGPTVRDFNRPGAVTVEASGTVTLDADYGGVVAIARGSTWDQVEAELIRQTGHHLAPTAKTAAKKVAAAKKKPKRVGADTSAGVWHVDSPLTDLHWRVLDEAANRDAWAGTLGVGVQSPTKRKAASDLRRAGYVEFDGVYMKVTSAGEELREAKWKKGSGTMATKKRARQASLAFGNGNGNGPSAATAARERAIRDTFKI